MPYSELLEYLRKNGDSVNWFQSEREGARLLTMSGIEYICSSQGQVFDGDGWKTKWVWVRK